jgi:hypothetical protein
MSHRPSSRRCWIAISPLLISASIVHGQSVNNTVSGSADQPTNTAPAPATRGQSFVYGVDAGIGESDNVTLVPTGKVDQTIAVTDVDFDLKQQSRRFDVDAKGDFSYLDFLQHAYGSELIGRFDGTAQAALIPGRVNWVLQDNFGQAQIDPFAAVTPTNRENVNYVSTGPDFTLKLGPTVFLDMDARYARTTYATDPFDSNRIIGNASLGVALSARSSVSFAGSFVRVLFDNTLVNTDFDRSSAYGHYEVQGARTEMMANLGVTKVDQGNESITGPLAKFQLSRKLSSASKLIFTVGRDLTDASTGFSTLQSGAAGGIITAPAVVTLTNYTVTYASIDWEYTRNRTTFGVSGTWEKDSYDGQPLQDLTRGDAEFRVERRLSRVLTAQLLGSVYRTEYKNTDFSETDGRIGAALTFREGRGLEIRLRYDHSSRVVSGLGSGYQENRAFLTVGYRPRVQQPT